ncbi:MAG: lytic transglycosylase domain-containing protein [Hyphomicrobiales bacterium]
MPASGSGALRDDEPAQTSTCDLVETSAAAHGLPVDYFTRLIWRESSFRPLVVSPVGAQGIAQFMPGTADERGLLDPFDPRQAIPASAHLLKALAERFGNLGLAAAAYNAGPRRVDDWLAGTGGLPRETRSYVAAITGRTAEEWRDLRELEPEAEPEAATTCIDVLASLDAPPLTSAALQAPDTEADWQPWGVQVAGNFSQGQALASYRRLQERHSAVHGDRDPLIIRSRDLSRGSRPIVHVRLPARPAMPPTTSAANSAMTAPPASS